MDNYELVKSHLTINTLVGHYGRSVAKGFINPAPCCENHDCCHVEKEGRLFTCFSCKAGGSVIDMVKVVERCGEAEALRKCASIAGVALKFKGEEQEESKPREGMQERMYRIAAEYYQAAMTPGCSGWEYFIKTRGHQESTLKRLRAGFATGKLLEYLHEHGFTPAEIVKYALATDTIKTKGEDGKEVEKTVPPFDYYKQGLVVFPVIDHAGKVISFTAKDPEKKHKASMLRGTVKKWFINYAALSKPYQELFVVEGENDVASLMDAGFENVVGTAGAPSGEQVTLLRNFCPGKTLYLWFDKDPDKDPKKSEGGPRHTRFIYEGLRGNNIDIRIIAHPGAAKDPDAYIGEIAKAHTQGGCAA